MVEGIGPRLGSYSEKQDAFLILDVAKEIRIPGVGPFGSTV